MLAPALPAELSPADVIGEDIDDIGPLAELPPQGGELGIGGLVILFPLLAEALFSGQVGTVGLDRIDTHRPRNDGCGHRDLKSLTKTLQGTSLLPSGDAENHLLDGKLSGIDNVIMMV